MDITDFTIQNPWWKGKSHIKDDKHIINFSEKKYQWHPPVLDELELIPDNIFSIRGPRQVGKTTLIKLMVRSLLEKSIPENAIFYASCDALIDHIELLKLIRAYLEMAASRNLDRTFIFLDEVSGIENWQKSVKLLVDS